MRLQDASELAHLPRHGGIPIPYTAPIIDGRPHFRATDGHKHNLCLKFQLCGVCGRHIAAPPYVFAVAPLCLGERLVFGTPMHPGVCAEAAFRLCPFLSREKWERQSEQGVVIYKREELPPKPARSGLGYVQSYATVRNPGSGLLYAELPADVRVQWWHYVDGALQPEDAND